MSHYNMRSLFAITLLLYILLPVELNAQEQDRGITLHLRGVYDSKISLMALTESRTFKSVTEMSGVKDGETTHITVLNQYLPGEFVLRFDYKEEETSTPYPSEKHIFIGGQDIELWVHPMYCNNEDSTWFQDAEKENSAFGDFSKENGRQREMLGLLQNFLLNYDDTESEFYRYGIGEYEMRRKTYNNWIDSRIWQDSGLFVSTLYGFQHLSEVSWGGNEKDRVVSLINHYFDGMDFSDPLIIRTSNLNKWMDSYVNLHGQMATTVELRDSLFASAGLNAIEEARKGDPLVYGWMVDYFFRGYESNGIDAGMKILEPYLNDTACLTSKRQEIARRLKGMETLVPGTIAPDIVMKDTEGNLFKLNDLETSCNYILVLFWSADCSHCAEMTDELYPWQQQPEVSKEMMVVAISLDETETEIKAWEQKIAKLRGWRHLLAKDGIRNKVADDYFVLSAPVMILLDSKTKKIVALPDTMRELKRYQ